MNIYDQDLPKNAVNFRALSPLQFLERAADVFPTRTAAIHGAVLLSYQNLHERAKWLASALAKRGVGKGDTVAVILPNVPAMIECHYGVPMCGAVLNALNTRLNVATAATC